MLRSVVLRGDDDGTLAGQHGDDGLPEGGTRQHLGGQSAQKNGLVHGDGPQQIGGGNLVQYTGNDTPVIAVQTDAAGNIVIHRGSRGQQQVQRVAAEAFFHTEGQQTIPRRADVQGGEETVGQFGGMGAGQIQLLHNASICMSVGTDVCTIIVPGFGRIVNAGNGRPGWRKIREKSAERKFCGKKKKK